MKKTLSGILLVAVTFIMLFAGAFSASAFSTEKCVGESVEVTTYAQLKDALENFSSGGNVVLKNDISLKDDSADCSIKITNYGAVTLDLNGYSIYVDSRSTKYLFDVTGQTRLYFVTSRSDSRSVVRFNTVMPDAATVRANHNFAEITNANVDFTMGSDSAYTVTTDLSDTSIFRIDKASEMNIYSGIIHNDMQNGNGVYIAANENNKQKLNFRIGGYAEIEVQKHCVTFDPANVRYVSFGSVRFESLNANKSLYERIKVPSNSSATLRDLWYTSQAGSSSAIYIGGIITINQSQKVASLKKANIIVDKVCEALSNADYYILLHCAGGHVRLCGTCFMACNGVEAHSMVSQIGLSASCTMDGRTSGESCTVCTYSSAKTIPKKGHNMSYTPGVEESCGVNGVKEHYYCQNCSGYFADAEGKTAINRNEIIVENTHKTTYLPQVLPTCTDTGLTSGIKCETCGKITKKQEIVPAKGHNKVAIETPVEPSCSKEGRTAGEKCSTCGVVFEESKVLPQKAHTTEFIEGYPASCTQNGLSFGEYCIVCGYVIQSQKPIPPTGHIEKILEGKKATCQEEGLTDGLVCEVCDLVTKGQEKIEKGAHVPEIIKGKEATCKEEGLTAGSICRECGIVLEKQEKIPVNDEHKEIIVKGTPASCQSEGLTDGSKCERCDKVFTKQQIIEKLPHTQKVVKGTSASCEKEGLTDGIVCAVCDTVIEKQVTIEKTAHIEKVVKGTPATCKNEGKTDGIVCSVCDKVISKQEILSKLPHAEKITLGKDATCTEEGLSEGISCSVCGETIKKQTVIEKKSHTLSVSVIRADFEKNGEVTETCTVCKKQISKKELSKIDSVTLSATKYTYNGKAKTPSLTVKTAKGEALKKGTDYTVSYSKGRTAVGTYKVKVTFTGNYSGEKTLSFTVTPSKTAKITASQSTSAIKLSWSKVEGATGYKVYLYDTKTKKYKALGKTAKLSGTIKKLKAGTSYKFAIKAYTKTDSGTVWSSTYTTITTATKTAVPTVTVKAGSQKASLSWKKVSGATGYVVYMSEKKDSGYKKLGSTQKLSCTIKNLKKGKTYYFRVRTYKKVDGKYIYSTACKYKAVKIK